MKEKIIGNYTTQPNSDFPLDCEALQYIEDNRAMVELLGNIAGDKVILRGCNLTKGNTERTAGVVFVRTSDYPDGELIYFAGGTVSTGMYLRKTSISVTANNNAYPQAYTIRALFAGLAGSGEEQFSWNEFVEIDGRTNRKLMEEVDALNAKIATLQPAPVGAILIWPSDNIPTNYKKCDGSSLSKTEYAELFAVIGNTFGYSGNQFKIPNLQGRFVAGKDGVTYSTIGGTGGENRVTLTSEQMPVHKHAFKYRRTDRPGGSVGKNDWVVDVGGSTESEDTENAGGKNDVTQSHENRPPYMVMNYIIKVK